MRDFLYKAISSGGCVGYIPVLSGSLGTLEGVGLYLVFYHYLEQRYLTMGLGIALLFFTTLSFILGKWATRYYGQKDPSCFIIDEIAGFFVAFFLVDFPHSPALFISIGFIIYRLFDIIKPFPIKQVQRLNGGLSIVLDDLIAGLYTNLLFQIILKLYKT